MKKRLFALVVVALLITVTTAFAEDTASVFDLSAEQLQIAELGIPTVSSVNELKSKADNLWNNKDYQNAAPAYAAYAKQANWLANIISQGLEPYYSASYDDREDFYPSNFELKISILAIDESKANSYKTERNRAMLYEGLCYYYLNDYETALPLISKSLDLIDIEDEANWILGKNALYAIVGYISAIPTPTPAPTRAPAKQTSDGEAIGTGKGFVGDIKVKVITSGGMIASVEVLSCSDTPGICDVAISTIPTAIVTANSVEVDCASGATFTSKGIIEAARNALQQLEN